MKRININFIGAEPTIVFVAPGIWKATTSDGLTSRLVVLNQTPNQHMEDWGGYNAIDGEADTYYFPTGYSISIKQFTTYAAEFALATPKGCLANYRTLEECADAIEADTVTYGIMLFDNV